MSASTSRFNLVILAAGAGSRYGGLKPLAPIGPRGEALLEYSVFDALKAGFDRVVLVVSPDAESAFRERLGGLARRVPVTFVHQRLDDLPVPLHSGFERSRPWGTGQAVLAAEAEIDRPFAVVNADDLYGAESFATLARFLAKPQSGRALAAVGFHVVETLTAAGPVSRALLEVGPDGRLSNLVEYLRVFRDGDSVVHRDEHGNLRSLERDALVSMNMWGFTPLFLGELRRRFADFLARSDLGAAEEFLLPEAVQSIVADGGFHVNVLPGSGQWCGMTFREDQERVEEFVFSLIDQGRYPRELWE